LYEYKPCKSLFQLKCEQSCTAAFSSVAHGRTDRLATYVPSIQLYARSRKPVHGEPQHSTGHVCSTDSDGRPVDVNLRSVRRHPSASSARNATTLRQHATLCSRYKKATNRASASTRSWWSHEVSPRSPSSVVPLGTSAVQHAQAGWRWCAVYVW
jgi:hypothetical protein